MTLLKEARRGLGLTQEEVAKRSDISRCYYCQLERSRGRPSLQVAQRIAETLGLSLDAFKEDANV